jgi:hypothetical protein
VTITSNYDEDISALTFTAQTELLKDLHRSNRGMKEEIPALKTMLAEALKKNKVLEKRVT